MKQTKIGSLSLNRTRNSATEEIARDAAIQCHLRSSVVVQIDAEYMTFY